MKKHFLKYGIIYKNVLAFGILREVMENILILLHWLAIENGILSNILANVNHVTFLFLSAFISMQIFRLTNSKRVFVAGVKSEEEYPKFIWFIIKNVFGFKKIMYKSTREAQDIGSIN